MSAPKSPAGWYPDPEGHPGQRWWSGAEWGPTRPTPSPSRRRGLPILIFAGGVLLLALLVSAGSGFGGFLSTVGLAAVIVGVVGVARRGIRWLLLPGRAASGAALALGVVVLLIGGGVSGATDPVVSADRRDFVDARPTASPASTPRAVVTSEEVVVTEPIPFESATVEDASLPQGTSSVTTPGVAGERTITYRVDYRDGVETGRRVIRDEVTVPPVTEVTTVGTMAPPPPAPRPAAPSGGCHSSYSPCVPIASDVDCAGGSGNGPAYVSGPISVIGPDVYGLDRDGDGVACE